MIDINFIVANIEISGVCPSASLVTWVGLQPFLLSGLLLLRLLAGVVGVLPPVSG